MEWVATGRVFGPTEALAGGLVSELLPEDRLLARARELAREIVENTSPVSVALSRGGKSLVSKISRTPPML